MLLDAKMYLSSGFGELISFTDWLQFRQNLGYSYSYDERNTSITIGGPSSGTAPSDGLGMQRNQIKLYESISTSESLLTFQ